MHSAIARTSAALALLFAVCLLGCETQFVAVAHEPVDAAIPDAAVPDIGVDAAMPEVDAGSPNDCTTFVGSVEIHNDLDWQTLIAKGCRTIMGNVVILEPGPTNLSESGRMTVIDGDLTVFRSTALESVSLPALTSILGGVNIDGNTALTSLSLPALTWVGGWLSINEDTALTSLSLPALTSVPTNMSIYGNTALESVSLPALTSVGMNLFIDFNPALTSVSLPALTSVGWELNISNNPALPQCQADRLADQLGGRVRTVSIYDNDKTATCMW